MTLFSFLFKSRESKKKEEMKYYINVLNVQDEFQLLQANSNRAVHKVPTKNGGAFS